MDIHTFLRAGGFIGFVLALATGPLPSSAALIDIADFVQTTDVEFLNPHFDTAGGQTTTRDYSGFVEVVVNGVGSVRVDVPGLVDAFYGNIPIGPALFDNSLRLGTEIPLEPLPRGFSFRANCSLHVECGAVHVAEFAVAFDGPALATSGPFPLDVTSGFAPAFNPGSEYHFIIDLGEYLGTLTFGNGDGGAFDNSGSYNIALHQVQLAKVSEPGTLPLVSIGLVALIFWMRDRYSPRA